MITAAIWRWSGLFYLLLFAGLVRLFLGWGPGAQQAPAIDPGLDSVTQLGQALVDPNLFVVPFEVASVLLLAALIGAIVVAWEKK